VIETCQTNVENDFAYEYTRSGHGKGEVKHHYGRKQKGQKGEHDCSKEELIEIVIAGINTVAEDITFLPTKEMKQRD
jgi:hypothetical protein